MERFFELIIFKKIKYAYFKEKAKKIIFNIEIDDKFVFFIKSNKEIKGIIIHNTSRKR